MGPKNLLKRDRETFIKVPQDFIIDRRYAATMQRYHIKLLRSAYVNARRIVVENAALRATLYSSSAFLDLKLILLKAFHNCSAAQCFHATGICSSGGLPRSSIAHPRRLRHETSWPCGLELALATRFARYTPALRSFLSYDLYELWLAHRPARAAVGQPKLVEI